MTGLYAPLSPVARWTCPPEPKANIKAKYKPETHLDHPAAAEGTATAALACPHHYHRHEGGGVVAWRDKYKVHPYADHYPMMEGEQFADLVRDITEKGLKTPITVDKDGILLDGRNRLEALERAGIELRSWQIQIYRGDDRVGFIKSANAHRRHLTKQQVADLTATDLIKAAEEEAAKLGQTEPVSTKGGRSKKNPVRQASIEEAKKRGYSESTARRGLAKARGKTPPTKAKLKLDIDAARQHYLDKCADPDVDLDAEQEIIIDALREIAGKRAF